jgi:hypothetical protein
MLAICQCCRSPFTPGVGDGIAVSHVVLSESGRVLGSGDGTYCDPCVRSVCKCRAQAHYAGMLAELAADQDRPAIAIGDRPDAFGDYADPAVHARVYLPPCQNVSLARGFRLDQDEIDYGFADAFETEAREMLAELTALNARARGVRFSHVGPTELTWQPLTYRNRMGQVRTTGGQSLGAMTLDEAGVHYLAMPLRVLQQDLICMRHPACGLDTDLCEPETIG